MIKRLYHKMLFHAILPAVILISSVSSQYYLKDQTLGCDGVVGSGVKLDRCGVCGGHNESCKIISGIYTKRITGAKYEYITDLPAGATSINITEARNTRNYIALRYATNLTSIINGNWSLNWSGEYVAAGSTVVYRKPQRHHSHGENIYIQGPITTGLQLLLLVQTRNPGIYYQYAIPINTKSTPTKKTISRERDRSRSRYVSGNIGELHAFTISKQSQYMFTKLHTELAGTALRDLMGGKNKKVTAEHTSLGPILHGSRDLTPSSEKSNDAEVGQINRVKLDKLTSELNGTKTGSNSTYLGDSVVDLRQLASKYEWKTIASQCTRTCGEGYKEVRVLCVSKLSIVAVTNDNCAQFSRPRVTKVPCNIQPCAAEWEVGAWSACSASCGSGFQTRKLECKQRTYSNQSVLVHTRECQDTKQPGTVRVCSTKDCYTWQTTSWSDCSSKCGEGSKFRSVRCVDMNGKRVDDSLCFRNKPNGVEKCHSNCSHTWFYTEWSNGCSTNCNHGKLIRKVHCPADRPSSNSQISSSNCGEKKPDTVKACKQTDLCKYRGRWFNGEWSECKGDCQKAYQYREVICLVKRGYWNMVTYDEHCLKSIQPAIKKECQPAYCSKQRSWFMTDWSKCSATCGNGVRRRQVKCFDEYMNESIGCLEDTKPSTTESCKAAICESNAGHSQTEVQDFNCIDKYKSCELVVKAKLCRIPYYRRLCCASCNISS